MGSRRLTFVLACILTSFAPFAGAQAQPINVKVANLEQDVRIMQRELGKMRLEMEALMRENERLRDALIQKSSSERQQYVTLVELSARMEDLRAQTNAALEKNKRDIIEQVSGEIESLAAQTQKALKAVASSVEAQPRVAETIVFNDNYPKSGTSYTVKSGDSLAKIARAHDSKVDWIRNANRLANDTIFPGQELFIPQSN